MLKILTIVTLISPAYAFAESEKGFSPYRVCGTKPIVKTKEQVEAQKLRLRESLKKLNDTWLAKMQKSNKNISEYLESHEKNCKSPDRLDSKENKSTDSDNDSAPSNAVS